MDEGRSSLIRNALGSVCEYDILCLLESERGARHLSVSEKDKNKNKNCLGCHCIRYINWFLDRE
ncbi:hypothetical protein NEOLI_005459 [Neolecta irregularis DAH-3]|uniref:Uncharacterized protein n=1 Tax=Neolecta irregularis (strain DAH-3) TaxID=1198029 RepID=A0A1U7LKR5_NEOID|nr:hypothetical protein NEOLI_005459 [Neolecta irregularis DAH-3]|eukprot:OLL23228.1 hypothetical protein NEOLI_005459 [Neolecta irregularis DAH-3]